MSSANKNFTNVVSLTEQLPIINAAKASFSTVSADLKIFSGNAAASAAGLKAGDFYKIFINPNYLVAVVA